ncbi:uncharacterized protein HMPREF1541_05809 [Cyphellophora europaea CBS 101466]|uniref:Transcription factor BYE1 n=1 Tax=Cyphellophora europaea (strain CBS 101466) TaxID=1220924 RepID=W2RUZ3_CYPE1|nr:uncharacterized protein HMPREF1541_05809 [Cyphellophora europaea CBS 101466]ETN39583.1 hypothetical protein HMPREF1541_05809 [Cyphellophora europaea CBS 101466]
MTGMLSPAVRHVRRDVPVTHPISDETRRSGRATKGQHTKDRDITEAAPKKKGTAKKVNKTRPVEEEEEEEPEEKIRCICGEYEEETDIPRAMVCCDNCDAWQHNDCMGLPEDYEADSYFCEECKPENHKPLVAAIKKGQRPWEEAAKRRAALIEAERSAKKKGKKGGRKSAAAEEAEGSATPTTGQKRKAEESPAPSETKVSCYDTNASAVLTFTQGKKAKGTPQATPSAEPAARGRKAATATPIPPSPSPAVQAAPAAPKVPKDAKELPQNRKAPGQSLVKLFIDQTKLAAKDGFAVPQNQTAESYGTHLGLLVENAIHEHSAGTPTEQETYKTQLQAVLLNIKRNQPLSNKIVRGVVTPEQLSSMNSAEMASDEQRLRDAEMQAQLDKQSTLVGQEEPGPRIRRTHKGDEYVEDLNKSSVAESEPKPAPVRSASDVKSPTSGRRQPSVTIPNRRTSGDPRRQSSVSNFDISNVYSNVQGSPIGDQRFGELPSQPSNEVAGPGARPDADIDNLLKDEDASGRSSPPYSPRAADEDGAVWRGIINGGNVGRFHNTFKFAAGAPIDAPTLRLTWEQLLPNEIGISGRIDPSKADDYLCGLEFSTTSDLIVLWMGLPPNPAEADQFEKFFTYFKSKDRFGVGAQNHNPALKDIYFIPLEKGAQMPTFFSNLQSDFPHQVQERMILIPLVIKNSELPHVTDSPAVGGTLMQTPITPRDSWQPDAVNGGVPPPAMASHGSGLPGPMNGGGSGASTQQHQPGYPAQPGHQQPPFPTPSPHQQQQQQQQQPLPPHQIPTPHQPSQSPAPAPPQNASQAAHAAYKILGPYLSLAPAVQQLVSTAPSAGEQEMSVVKECIADNPAAAEQLDVLTQMLTRKWEGQQQSQSQQGANGSTNAGGLGAAAAAAAAGGGEAAGSAQAA